MIYLHGKPPYRAVFLHGGPGAPGSAAIAARELSKTQGILEPWQSAHSIAGLLEELEMQLGAASLPCSLLGHSWGAMLALLFAARHPGAVQQLLLVSCPPLTADFAGQITDRRLKNLSAADAARFLELSRILSLPSQQNRDGLLSEFGPFGRKGRRRRSPVSPGAGKYRCRRLCVHLGRSRNTAQCGRILAGFTEDRLSGLCASWRTGPPSFGWSTDSPAEHTNPLSVDSVSLLRPHTFSGAGCRRILLSGRSKNPVRRAGHPLTLQRPWLIVIPAYHEGVFREWIHFAAYIIPERFPQYRFRRQCRLRQIRKIFFAHFPFKAHAAPFAGPSDPAKDFGRRNNGHSFFAL